MNRETIIVASGNKHKIQEIKGILKDMDFDVLSKDDVGLQDFEVIEDGNTLEENAIKKAIEISKKVNRIIIADDTGLFVEKLNGEPGVYSSRYAGENVTYEDNNKKLLEELKNVPMNERNAKFRTAIAIVLEDKSIRTVEGECKGKIAFEPRGNGGFGYDSLFMVEGYDKTFAQLGEEIKNNISHRANALKNLRNELDKITRDDR